MPPTTKQHPRVSAHTCRNAHPTKIWFIDVISTLPVSLSFDYWMVGTVVLVVHFDRFGTQREGKAFDARIGDAVEDRQSLPALIIGTA
jgi:hypothetical protein